MSGMCDCLQLHIGKTVNREKMLAQLVASVKKTVESCLKLCYIKQMVNGSASTIEFESSRFILPLNWGQRQNLSCIHQKNCLNLPQLKFCYKTNGKWFSVQ